METNAAVVADPDRIVLDELQRHSIVELSAAATLIGSGPGCCFPCAAYTGIEALVNQDEQDVEKMSQNIDSTTKFGMISKIIYAIAVSIFLGIYVIVGVVGLISRRGS